MKRHDHICIRDASENNLCSVSLEIPKNKLVVVTGVSGSGKSSLVFDVIYREAEHKYLATFTAYARQFLQKTRRPEVEHIEGLSPAIAIDQHAITRNPRSTVGTLTEIYDYLRLLYARVGKAQRHKGTEGPTHHITNSPHHHGTTSPHHHGTTSPHHQKTQASISRSLFSFNSIEGACPVCKGLGVEDRLDPELLVSDPLKTLREGALVITAPNGYIIYSQVTLDVLNQVCQAEGFNIDIPWLELTPEQKDIILYGSNMIEVPFGKHPLESRMRWSGITAKPREMGYYKGIFPIMETILKSKRNKNILRFVRTSSCSACNGKRLNPKSLSVTVNRHNIASLASQPLEELKQTLDAFSFSDQERAVARPIIDKVTERITTLEELGLGYLALDRESTTLSAGEAQRIRLGIQVGMGLQGLLYIFDEPSIGLHPKDSMRIINTLKSLRDKGNSVIVVEHEEEFIRHADWLIDIGPGAGTNGGEILINSPISELSKLPEETINKSQTLQYLLRHKGTEGQRHNSLTQHRDIARHVIARNEVTKQTERRNTEIVISGATHNNLKNITVSFNLNALNIVTGVSGAGKSSLVNDVLGKKLPGTFQEIRGLEEIHKVITIDQSPIGKTSRSNPATYTGLFDLIRTLFASLPESIEKRYGKSRFSFNTKGGRCESCQGAGYHQIGMHFMGTVEIICPACQGKQFDEETLQIRYRDKNIAEVLALTISEALLFFHDQPKVIHFLRVLESLGLGYLHMGQRSSTLSGGEAQRVKLATELARPVATSTLYLLDEPTTGLHNADVANLLEALQGLIKQQNTVIIIEHHPALILAADHIVDLGPGSGKEGGTVIATGSPEEIMNTRKSPTGQALRRHKGTEGQRDHITPSPARHVIARPTQRSGTKQAEKQTELVISGVTTNNLKRITVRIPHEKITVITGVSGSGKSSLAFDTIYAEGQNRYLESFSAYARAQIGIKEKPDFDEVSGLTPTFAVDQRNPGSNPRSTVGTFTGIYDILRLLYARYAIRDTRYAIPENKSQIADPGSRITDPVVSTLFSFNDQQGACVDCDGLGTSWVCNPEKLISNPEKPLSDGALDGTRTGRFYGESHGQYISTLNAVGARHGIDYSKPWMELSEEAKQLALEGSGEEVYDITWRFKRKERTGEHHFKGRWIGLVALVGNEYKRKHADHRGEEMKSVMKEIGCLTCQGSRLSNKALAYRLNGYPISTLAGLPVNQLVPLLTNLLDQLPEQNQKAAGLLINELQRRLKMLVEMGLNYLSLNRPVETLSGGEFQRVKLSGQMGSGLNGITYILDEPTAGLHPSDTGPLLNRIKQLQKAGNTIVMVEHDPEVIRQADFILDLGPGAGKDGGEIISSGKPEDLLKDPQSVTGKYLKRKGLKVTSNIRQLRSGIQISDTTMHNLDHLSVNIPSNGITAITGVSGSGKSTLLYDVLYASWEQNSPQGCRAISGFHHFKEVVAVRQKRQFGDTRGTPVTYSGIFDHIRNLFARSDKAREMGLKKSHFSFISPDGRCETCNGSGELRISMDFMADIKVPCETCSGTRYKEVVRQCAYQKKTIADVLQLSFQEAEHFFANQDKIAGPMKLFSQIGLGYLQLGQPLSSLSGGESQRLTLAKELISPGQGSFMFLFDEPSSGLHPADLPALITLFDELADQGHTLVMIEHNPELILHADWLIDLGPDGGDQGGKVVAQGRVEEILAHPDSKTGKFLAKLKS